MTIRAKYNGICNDVEICTNMLGIKSVCIYHCILRFQIIASSIYKFTFKTFVSNEKNFTNQPKFHAATSAVPMSVCNYCHLLLIVYRLLSELFLCTLMNLFLNNFNLSINKMENRVNKLAGAIGELVKKHREKKQLTQEQLANLLGVHKTRVSWIERGLSLPQISTIFLLCEELDIRPTEFLLESFKAVDIDKLKAADLQFETRNTGRTPRNNLKKVSPVLN